MDPNDIGSIDLAESILRRSDCRIQSFLASGETQYVVKRGKMSISPSFLTIRLLCQWVNANIDEKGYLPL